MKIFLTNENIFYRMKIYFYRMKIILSNENIFYRMKIFQYRIVLLFGNHIPSFPIQCTNALS